MNPNKKNWKHNHQKQHLTNEEQKKKIFQCIMKIQYLKEGNTIELRYANKDGFKVYEDCSDEEFWNESKNFWTTSTLMKYWKMNMPPTLFIRTLKDVR